MGSGEPPITEDWQEQVRKIGNAPFWAFVDWWLLPHGASTSIKECDVWVKCKFCEFHKHYAKGVAMQHTAFQRHLVGMVNCNDRNHGSSAALLDACRAAATEGRASIVPHKLTVSTGLSGVAGAGAGAGGGSSLGEAAGSSDQASACGANAWLACKPC
jgi:hypothetical protein